MASFHSLTAGGAGKGDVAVVSGPRAHHGHGCEGSAAMVAEFVVKPPLPTLTIACVHLCVHLESGVLLAVCPLSRTCGQEVSGLQPWAKPELGRVHCCLKM